MGTTGGQATFAGWPARLLRDGKIQRQLARLTMPSSPSTHCTKCDEGYDEARQIKLPQPCITYLLISTL